MCEVRLCRQASRSRGTVSIEMLMAFLPLTLVFLGIVQLTQFRLAQLVVQHAATRGARSAIVILDDDPEYYDDAPRGDLTSGSSEGQGSTLGEDSQTHFGAFGDGGGSGDGVGARFAAIRSSAYHPLSVLAPPVEDVLGAARAGVGTSSSGPNMSGSPWVRLLFGSVVYNKAASVVTVHQGANEEVATRITGVRAPVRVKVSYLLRCTVPFVRALMCMAGRELLVGGWGLSFDDDIGAISERLELVESATLRDLLLGLGGRYVFIEAEATMPNQGAQYHEGE